MGGMIVQNDLPDRFGPLSRNPVVRRPATPAELSIHNDFLESVRTARKELVRAAFYLAELVDRKVHKVFGYADGPSYAVSVAGLSERQARDLLRMGRRLRERPELASAVAEGSLSWGKALLLAGRLGPGEGGEWIERAKGMSEVALKTELRNSGKGGARSESVLQSVETSVVECEAIEMTSASIDQPCHPKPEVHSPGSEKKACAPERPIHVTLSFAPDQYAAWERVVAVLRKAGEEQSLGALHLDALESLSGNRVPGRDHPPRSLLVVLTCPECRSARLPTSRGEVTAPPALIAAVECDAVVDRDDGNGPSRRQVVPPRLRRTVLRRDRYRCQGEGCTHVHHLEIHNRVPVAHGGRTELENLVTLCSRCHRGLHERETELEKLRPPV